MVIDAELRNEYPGRTLDRGNPDDIYDVAVVAAQMSIDCKCSGYDDGCEHEALVEVEQQVWVLESDVAFGHWSEGSCDNCDTYEWAPGSEPGAAQPTSSTAH